LKPFDEEHYYPVKTTFKVFMDGYSPWILFNVILFLIVIVLSLLLFIEKRRPSRREKQHETTSTEVPHPK